MTEFTIQKDREIKRRISDMGYTIAQKIIKNHLVSGEMIPGTEIGLRSAARGEYRIK